MAKRKLKLPNGEYEYYIGSGSAVIKAPSGIKKVVSLSDIKGLTPDDIERGRWKKNSDGMIRPGEVRKYIEEVGLK